MTKNESEKYAALYIRVSTDAQAEEGYSIDAQKEMLIAYCKSKRIENYNFYIDGGFTGSNIERPKMQELIEHVKENKIQYVIVYKLDRLSRSQKDTLYLIEDVFNFHSAEFISLNENLDTSTPIGRAMLGIMSAFAQLERETIRERTRMGMKERVKNGFWMGGGRIPFGYDYDKEKGILVKNKDAETVKKVYELYLQGYSLQKISNLVGLKYDKLALQILIRKTNVGLICYNGDEYQGKHEPIISLEIYNKAMDMMKERSANYTTTSENYLQGLIYCGKCSAKMRYQKWGKSGYKIYCYSQQKSKKYLIKDPNCDNLKTWADEVENIVIKDLLSISWDKINNEKKAEKTLTILEVLNENYRQTSEKLKKLYTLYSTSSDDDILLQSINELKDELAKLRDQINREQERKHISTRFEETMTQLDGICDLWQYMSFAEKQNIIRNVVDKIIITDNNVNVFYKFIGNLK